MLGHVMHPNSLRR